MDATKITMNLYMYSLSDLIQFQNSKAELLESLHQFIAKYPKKVLPYAVELKVTLQVDIDRK